ncbi:MAG: hypothetical protein E6K99_06765 [Thaumarchaeota archaeon]|nr:MAG: hypothetical protein E6K86_09725 [Nitrososphaerota archaeon]TMP98755.1 MAG: hypothetical protein E6K99_06765 [Nitrososphaerota archaeon]
MVSNNTVAGICGLATVLQVALLEIAFPYVISGPRLTGSSSLGSLLATYSNPALVGTFWPAGVFILFVLFVLGIYLALRDAAASAGMSIFLLAAVAVAFMEVPVLLTRTALQWTLVSITAQHGVVADNSTRIALEVSGVVVYRIYDVLYNSLLYWIEGGYVLLLGLVILRTRVFAHLLGWFSLIVGVYQFFNTLGIPLGIPDALVLVGNSLLILWTLLVSISLLRLRDRSAGFSRRV